MVKQSLNGVLQQLRNVAAVQTYRELSDCDLLERFVGAHDEAAFTVLIERHGPMVLGVCRRALANFHDAEDACQAAFLVLARKAASIRKRTSLGSWLHGVACRVAAKLKRDHARRKSRERGLNVRRSKDPAAEVTWREVQTILDEELQRLPERYRVPLIFCYLECKTRDQAGQQLGLSPGSLHGRLERARDLLRERLGKRGLTLSGALFAVALGESVAPAALAPTFVVSSTKAAMRIAAGRPLIESGVATNVLVLTQEVLKSMFLTKLRLGTAAMLCAGLFTALIFGFVLSPGIARDTTEIVSRGNRSDDALQKDDAKGAKRNMAIRIEINLPGAPPAVGENVDIVATIAREGSIKTETVLSGVKVLFVTAPRTVGVTVKLSPAEAEAIAAPRSNVVGLTLQVSPAEAEALAAAVHDASLRVTRHQFVGLPENHRAMAFRLQIPDDIVKSGSAVDILVVERHKNGTTVRKVVDKVKVLAIDAPGNQAKGEPIVTLAVSPAQAEALALAEQLGTLRLVALLGQE